MLKGSSYKVAATYPALKGVPYPLNELRNKTFNLKKFKLKVLFFIFRHKIVKRICFMPLALKATLYVIALIVGFILLVKGADWFVDGASGIAKKLKISSFVIGLTVVALGTSAPEAAVSIVGAVHKNGDIIIGNVLGSNILNIFLILGISALICKLPVEKSSKIIDLPFLILSSVLFVVFGFFGSAFAWWEGLILLALYVAYMLYTVLVALKQSKAKGEQATAISLAESDDIAVSDDVKEKTGFKQKFENLKTKTWFLIILTVIGLGLVVGGAQLVVDSSQFIAEELFKIPTEIVALTVVAFGTSLPELVTSVSAARKGDVGIATGNIIGSNIANILLIGGLGFVCSGGTAVNFSMDGLISGIVSIAAAVLILCFSFGKSKSLSKVSGAVMLCCLVGYYVYLFLNLHYGWVV